MTPQKLSGNLNHKLIAFPEKKKYYTLRKTYRKGCPVRKEDQNGCIHHVELFIWTVRVPVAARKGTGSYGKIRQEAKGKKYALIGYYADSIRYIVRQPPVSDFSDAGGFFFGSFV